MVTICRRMNEFYMCFFFFQAEDGIRDLTVTGVQTCALPISQAVLEARKPDTRERRIAKTIEAMRERALQEELTRGRRPLGRPEPRCTPGEPRDRKSVV